MTAAFHRADSDGDGRIVHRRGVTDVPGLYFVGLAWRHTRGPALLGSVADDARHLARLARRHRDDLATARSRRSTPVDPPTASRGVRSHGR